MEIYETKTKAGKIEERIFKDAGKFVIYAYKDKDTGKQIKEKLILIGNGNRAYFLIPTGSRDLAIPAQFDLDTSLKEEGTVRTVKDYLDNIK
ncbi:hypothetical protein [Ferroplasma sp.]|uniref:hypothetical protein n=1 Tax=Ferroplasma sp. TaxID=2591003 RepID=UPI00307E1D05